MKNTNTFKDSYSELAENLLKSCWSPLLDATTGQEKNITQMQRKTVVTLKSAMLRWKLLEKNFFFAWVQSKVPVLD